MGCLVLIPPPLVTPLPGELIQGPDGEGREGAFVGCPAPRPPFPPSAMLCGGLSQPKAATAETQQITQEIKSQLEEKESRKFDIFDAVSYKTQVVAGINYFIKIHVGNDEYFHVRVYQRLPHKEKPLELTNYQSKKEKHEDLTYF